MNFAEFAASRKSVRGFTKQPVTKETVDAIINAAKWAPSSYNTQTWKIHAVTGDVLDRIREGNTKNTLEGKPHVRDFPYKEDYEGIHRQRQIDVAIQLLPSSTITYCPYKGKARYYSIRVGDVMYKDIVWFYQDPVSESDKIKNYLCFYDEKVDEISVDYHSEIQYGPK